MSKTPIDILLDRVAWDATGSAIPKGDGSLPVATHSGVLELFGHKLRCYRLSDGRAVFHADDMNEFLGLLMPPSREYIRE